MAAKGKKVLGIDTSLRSTGWAVIEASGSSMRSLGYGTVKNRQSLPHSECFLNIRNAIETACRTLQPEEASIEGVFFSKNLKTTLILGEARGVVIATCAAEGVPVYEYSPRRVKQSLVGSGRVGKQQVAGMVKNILGLSDDLGDDESDALALAICHIHSSTNIAALAPKQI